MCNLFILISEAHRNFRNELFDSVEAQCNSAIVERHFRTVTFCQKDASQCGQPVRMHNLSSYSLGGLINPSIHFHFYLWLRWS